MRNDNDPSFFGIYGLRYGADTSGLTVVNAPEFIRKRAYQLFEMRGRHPGHELDDWLQAEREIQSRFGVFGIPLGVHSDSLLGAISEAFGRLGSYYTDPGPGDR
jgi:Protein of unknown function (DUF2934)